MAVIPLHSNTQINKQTYFKSYYFIILISSTSFFNICFYFPSDIPIISRWVEQQRITSLTPSNTTPVYLIFIHKKCFDYSFEVLKVCCCQLMFNFVFVSSSMISGTLYTGSAFTKTWIFPKAFTLYEILFLNYN